MEDLEDEYAIGLDLGTTFSCIGVYRNGWVEIIPNKNGEKITPSVVIISNDQKILVGEETTNFLVKNYDSCIYEVKRLIGRQITEEERKKLEERFPFKIVKSQKGNFPEIKITKDGKTKIYSPVEISSYIIKKMVSNAEKYLNKKITKLVITVPAYFNDSQRKLTRQAAEAIGLKVLRIINEPTAAALAYGFDSKLEHNKKIILVFDLGGGTFDVSILSLDKNEEDKSTKFEVLGTSGDTNLGGEDFDNILVDIVLNKVHKYVDTNKIRENKEAMRKLKISCENAKKLLSLVDIAHIRIYNIVENVDIFLKVERSEFEEGCKPLFDKLKKPIESALEMAKLDSGKIKEVILVGGSTRIPKIKEIIRNYFSESEINDSINPDEVVAFGATIEAEKILHNKDKNIKNITLLDIVPFSLGTDIVNNSTNEEIKKEGDRMDVIIKRGSSLNTPKSKKYRTTQDDQTIMPINIYEGDNEYVKYNHLLKKCNISGLTKRPKGKTKVIIKFNVDESGTLNVEAKEIADDNKGQSVNLTVKNDEINLPDEDIDKLKEKMEKLMKNIEENIKKEKIDFIEIKCNLKKYKDSYQKYQKYKDKKKITEITEEDLIIYILNYCNTLEKLIAKLDTNFDNETVLFKFYLYIKDLFQSYTEALKFHLDKGVKDHIFSEINIYIEKFIDKSQGYLNELLKILSKQKRNYKQYFYSIIVHVISKLNELGKNCLIDGKKFCKYHSLTYFEQAYSYLEKYFTKEKNEEDERENMSFLDHDNQTRLKIESKLSFNYLNDIYSGAILLCKEFAKRGKLIDKRIIESGTGFTEKSEQLDIEAFKKEANLENQEIFLSNYENLLSMVMSTQSNSDIEAICIANIIKIYCYMEEKLIQKSRYLCTLAKRCQNIVEVCHLQNEEWYKEFEELYKKILEAKTEKDKNQEKLLEEMKKIYPDIFKELDDNFAKMKIKDFIDYIIKTHPYKDKKKEDELNFDNNRELIIFLLKKYSPDIYTYVDDGQDIESKLQHCLAGEISKKLDISLNQI